MIPINVEIGLKINDKIEYIPLGIFNIDNVKKNDFTIKITAYDNMSKFKIPYFSSLGDLATLPQVVNEISTKTGVQFEGSLPSYSVKKLEGFSCREVLGFVASLCGGNAIIKRNGKFTIIYPTDINRDIGEGYFDFSREEVKYKIGKITCKAEDRVLSKGSLGADSMELEFENPWATDSILNDIYNRLNGFEYLGYDLKWQGDPSLDIGDIITHKDDKGVIRKLPILNYKLSYDGGLDSELSAKGETKNKNSFDSSGSMKKKIDRVVTELAIVNEALIDVAYIGDLTANNIKFDTASGGTLDLQSLLVKFVSGENGQYLNLTSSNVVIDNAVIKDAMIDTISASKINTGVLDTNLVTVQGPSGNLLIKDNTIQIKDSNRTRVQIGKDASNDYNMYVWDSTGKLMFDATGLKADGIKSKIIRDDMVSDTANINGSKINISSLITEVNKDTNTQVIKASKIAFDSTGQSLEVSFNSLKSNVDNKESRNLILNGNFESGLNDWSKSGGVVEVIEENNRNILRLYANDTSGNRGVNQIFNINNVQVNEDYTLSLMCKKGQLNGNFQYYIWYLDSNNTNIGGFNKVINVTNEYSKVISTFKIPDNSNIKSLRIFIYCQEFTPTELFVYNIKVERGINPNPVWIQAPEDIKEKIQANTTAITVEQGRVNVLVSDSTIIKGDITTLKDNYTTIDTTVNGLKTTVSSHTTSITNLGTNVTNAQNTANNANTLADSKAKVFTSTPTTPYKIGDLWVQGTSGDVMKCKVARATGSYVASDWEKASKYTDDTTANAVATRVTATESSITQLNNQIALKVEKTYVDTTLQNYSTTTQMNTAIIQSANSIKSEVSNTYLSKGDAVNTYATKSSMDLTATQLKLDFSSSGGYNLIKNSSGLNGTALWNATATLGTLRNNNIGGATGMYMYLDNGTTTVERYAFSSRFKLKANTKYTLTGWFHNYTRCTSFDVFILSSTSLPETDTSNNFTNAQKIIDTESTNSGWKKYSITFTTPANTISGIIRIDNNGYNASGSGENRVHWSSLVLAEGSLEVPWSPHPDEIYSGNTTIDATGVTIFNGALTIKNKAGTNVLTSDTNGNLTIAGTFINKNWNGVDAIKIQDTSIYFYDWERNGRELGIIYSSYLTDYPNVRGLSLAHHNEGYMTLGYKTSTGYSSYIVFDKYAKNPTYQSPIRVLESAVFNSAVNLQNRVFMPSNVYFGSNSESTTPIVFRGVNTNQLTVQLSVTNVNDGLKIQTNTGGILAYILAGNNYPAYFNTNTYINGNFAASGSKNSLQTTEHYGERLINAYETAEYYFGDIGSGIIKDGECLINIDEILQECINTNAEYHIFTQVYKGTITRIERYSNYFIAYGEEGTKFSWELKAKRRGYENVRLDIPEIGTIENIAVFTEEDYKINTSEDILLSEITFNLENLLMEG
jgi:hypothetical protein